MPDAWAPGPRSPNAARGEVHVWRASLALPPGEIAALHELIGDDERSRAGRFRFEVHRNRFIAGRGIQRLLLARYLGAGPAALRYDLAHHGKPALAAPWSATELRFNVSNADDGLLIAVSVGRELGVDLEAVRTLGDRDDVARRFFSAPEV